MIPRVQYTVFKEQTKQNYIFIYSAFCLTFLKLNQVYFLSYHLQIEGNKENQTVNKNKLNIQTSRIKDVHALCCSPFYILIWLSCEA